MAVITYCAIHRPRDDCIRIILLFLISRRNGTCCGLDSNLDICSTDNRRAAIATVFCDAVSVYWNWKRS